MVLGRSSLGAVSGLGTLDAGAGTDDLATARYLSTGALGAAAGDTAVGLQTPYFGPPALSDPSSPGFTINSGADQPDPFMLQQDGRSSLFTSQDKVPQNVPVRSGTAVRHPVALAHLGFGPAGPYLAVPLEVSGPG